jgi:DNA gyrase subunit A
MVVREHQELVFISQNGMVQRTSVKGINRYGRASQGVRVMNLRPDDAVSAVALVMESEAETAASAASVDDAGPVDLEAVVAVDGDVADIADVDVDTDAEPAPAADEAGHADPLDDSTITPPEVSEEDLEI